MVDNLDLMLPTDDLGSYVEVPEKRGAFEGSTQHHLVEPVIEGWCL
jgi:hypothetical protein